MHAGSICFVRFCVNSISDYYDVCHSSTGYLCKLDLYVCGSTFFFWLFEIKCVCFNPFMIILSVTGAIIGLP